MAYLLAEHGYSGPWESLGVIEAASLDDAVTLLKARVIRTDSDNRCAIIEIPQSLLATLVDIVPTLAEHAKWYAMGEYPDPKYVIFDMLRCRAGEITCFDQPSE